MTIGYSSALLHWLEQEGYGSIASAFPQGGGSINESSILTTNSGQQFFLKQNTNAPQEMFAIEARSLTMIAASRSLPVPEPYYWDGHCLLMELVLPGTKSDSYWEQFGEQLATMHQHTRDVFGLEFQTYCGTTLQANGQMADGHQFFAENRLLAVGEMALNGGLLNQKDRDALERLCRRLPSLVPTQPASLIHGDLWSGNAHTSPTGHPVLIDPALYFGWREADIAMTQLFGGFPEAFYQSYQAAWPMEKDWLQRSEIYNLFHLLNHLNLFGSGYLSQTRAIIAKYS